MMRPLLLGAAVAALLLAGCSNSRRCEGEQRYQSAETLPTPGEIPGLTVPDSPSALRIPPPPAQPVPFGRKVEDDKGHTHYECLDTPPRVEVPELPAAPAKKKGRKDKKS